MRLTKEEAALELRFLIVSRKQKKINSSFTLTKHIPGHSVGRDAFIEFDVIPAIAELFEDSNDIVRKFAQQAIEMVAEVPFGAEGIVEVGLIPILVARLKQENDDIKVGFSSLELFYRVMYTNGSKLS